MRNKALLALTLLLLRVAPALGQPAGHVTGFNGFQWGAAATELEHALGPPGQREKLDRGMTVYAYRDSVAGFPSIALYAVIDSLGLVKGQHTVAIEAGTPCKEPYIVLRDDVKLRFPLLTPAEKVNNPSLLSFCDALDQGIASWATQWNDPDTGSVVTVLLEPDPRVIKVIYESAAFREWVATLSDS